MKKHNVAAAILFCRIFLGAVFAGNFSSIFYSAAGGFCAIAVTVGMKKLLTTRQLWVAGALGAMAHNIGQMAAAVAISQTPSLVIYLPLLLAIAIAAVLYVPMKKYFAGKDLQ